MSQKEFSLSSLCKKCQTKKYYDSARGITEDIDIKIFNDLWLNSEDIHTNTVFIILKIFNY